MRRIAPYALPAIVLAACGGPATVDDPDHGTPDAGTPAPAYCTGTTKVAYDPASKDIAIFPDDFWTVDDTSTATKRKLSLQAGVNVTVPPTVSQFSSLYGELSLLDGFGTTAPITVKIGGTLDPATLPVSGEGSGKADASLVLVKVGATPEFIDIETSLISETVLDATQTLVVAPMKPLLPKTEYALVLTQRIKDVKGGCLAPSQATMDLVDGKTSDSGLLRLQPRVASVVDALVKAGTLRAKEDVTAAVVFTTAHTTDGSQKIAADIRSHAIAYEKGACTVASGVRKCEGKIVAGNYRDASAHIDETATGPRSTYRIPMTTWLSADTAPTRVLIYAHGLGGTRTEIAPLAPSLAQAGWALVAIDAPKHGQHPDKAGILGGMELFGVSVNLSTFQPSIDSRACRDNMRQAAYDKLQMLEVLKAGLDVDGDGTADLPKEHFAYLGLSLGGIMGPEFLAYAPETTAAVLMVPGARLTSIMQDSTQFSAAVEQFRGSATDGDLARTFAMMQTAIDPGDPAVSAVHVLADRLPGFDSGTPQVLQQMVINDEIVPNVANRFFARAMGLPLLGDELQAIGDVKRITVLPAKDTVRAGVSAGVFQFDVIEGGKTATHNDLVTSDVAWAQVTPFFESAFTGSAELRDPYRDLHIKQ